MCGIYGSTIIYNKQEVTDKLSRTKFRGPDQSGYELFNDKIIMERFLIF